MRPCRGGQCGESWPRGKGTGRSPDKHSNSSQLAPSVRHDSALFGPRGRIAQGRAVIRLRHAYAQAYRGQMLPALWHHGRHCHFYLKANTMPQATGTFDVKLAPQTLANADAGPLMGRLSINKTFSGDLQATSQGEMLSAGTAVKGSAGYVAMERVTGTLHGKSGSFVLQHSGTMNRGAPQLTVSVVPDSGTDELTGLSGTLGIQIADGRHSYVMDYEIAPQA